MSDELSFADIRRRALNSNKLELIESARVAFRDVLDPYAAEYIQDSAKRWSIIKGIVNLGIPIPQLCNEYRQAFKDRPDIAFACIDALAFMLWEMASKTPKVVIYRDGSMVEWETEGDVEVELLDREDLDGTGDE